MDDGSDIGRDLEKKSAGDALMVKMDDSDTVVGDPDKTPASVMVKMDDGRNPEKKPVQDAVILSLKRSRSSSDEDSDDSTLCIGVRPKHKKLANELKALRRVREAEIRALRQQPREQQPPSTIPSFEDGSQLIVDYTTTGATPSLEIQYKDTCASLVFSWLVEFEFNRSRPVPSRRYFSWRHLAEYIRTKTMKKSYAFRNLNIPIKYLKSTGLFLKNDVGMHGLGTTCNFGKNMGATKAEVFDILDRTPLGICVFNSDELDGIEKGIHLLPPPRKRLDVNHAMMVVARGVTLQGVDFLVTQNTYGPSFGNGGFCRIFLPDNGRYVIFYPL